jgi:hypothetical protein
MTIMLRRALFIAPALVTLALVTTAGDVMRKCGGMTIGANSSLRAIDGVIVAKNDEPFALPKADEIHSIHVVCMNPQDSTFKASGTSGIPVLSVWTKRAVAQLTTSLEAVMAAQDAHFKKTAKYLSDVAAMALPATTPKVQISVTSYERGWQAHATMPRFMTTCTLFDGEVKTEQAVYRRQIYCPKW